MHGNDNSAPSGHKDAAHHSNGLISRARGELHKVIGRGYRGAFLLGFLVAALLQSTPGVAEALAAAELLLPMPMSDQRLAERGYNPALLL
ncbi:MAG TPA: hypothetical protein PLL10_07710, partial [Elusimicrobiales bacterium]|nr:hypothetical protein [Elusimicrobiales bacterium]